MCELVTPTLAIRAVAAGPDDDRVLECAVVAAADAVVSGDGHLLGLGVFRGIRMVSPADFLASLESSP